MKTLIDNKKHSSALARIVATAQLKAHGVECYFENASTAIAMQNSRSETLEAFKKDIDKTAGDILRSQPIIYSIKDGTVTEYDSIYNSVEEVFGDCYNKEKNIITLSGVIFDLSSTPISRSKNDFKEEILRNIFNIDAKELNSTLKTLSKYETTEDDVQKAILYPSTILADKIIQKIADEDVKFSKFRKEMSYEDAEQFDKTFKRTGVTGVIQNSTYIDGSGLKQLAPSHKQRNVAELIKMITSGNLKYVEAVEVDGDGSLEKMTHLINQIEKLTLNTSVKFTLKARKLGNIKARGAFFSNQLIVAEDVRDTSAIIHELGHLVHLITLEDNKFVNYMISKLTPMIELNDDVPKSKIEYYYKPTEVVARACEIAALFAQEKGLLNIEDDDFEIIKSKGFYAADSGKYFNFLEFDDETKEEMLALFELFYQTSPDCIDEGKYDNFVKIDTKFRRTKKEVEFYDLIKRERAKQKKELKALYSLVNTQNIEMIFTHRGNVSVDELARTILVNIQYCGNHKDRMTAPEWREVIENKSGVILYVVKLVQKSSSLKEWYKFLMDFKANAFRNIENEVFFSGFSDNFRLRLIEEFKKHDTPNYDDMVELRVYLRKEITELLDEETLKDEEFMQNILTLDPYSVKKIDENKISLELLEKYNRFVLETVDRENKSPYLHSALCDNISFMEYAIELDRMSMSYAGEQIKNNKDIMLWFLDKYGYENNLGYLGDSLRDNAEVARSIIAEDLKYLDYFSQRVQNLLDENPEERELKKLEGAKALYRRKVARSSKSMKILDVLSKDKNYEVRAEVAKNKHAAVGTLMDLAKSRNKWIKSALARNENTPVSILNKLLKDSDEDVLYNLAGNPSVGPQKIILLSRMNNNSIKWAVLRNPNVQSFVFSIEIHKEIVRNCLEADENYFYYELRTGSFFEGSYKFFDSLAKDTKDYIKDKSLVSMFAEMARTVRDARFPDGNAEEKEDNLSDFELLVTPEKEVQEEDMPSFDKLIEQGEIVEFERTDGKGVEKVLKIKTEIEDFKSFNQWMRSNKKGYYSRFAKGFILYEEFANKLTETISENGAKAASVATALYSADLLQNFASGKLF